MQVAIGTQRFRFAVMCPRVALQPGDVGVDPTGTNLVTRPRRLTHDARRESILTAAVDFFARHGLGGSTRELAVELGVSAGLINRYFSRESLIDAVYERVFADRLDQAGVQSLADSSVPLKTRLLRFYHGYVRSIDDPTFTRVSLFSALHGSMLGQKYLNEHIADVIELIAQQLRQPGQRDANVSPVEVERVWVLHSAIVYGVVRKYIHGMPVDLHLVVDLAVEVFLHGTMSRS